MPATTAADPSRKAISSAPVKRHPAAAGRCPGAASRSGGGPTARRGPPAAAPATRRRPPASARERETDFGGRPLRPWLLADL